MKKALAWVAVTLLLASGAVWATSNTWTYPVPTGGTLLTTGDVIYARDANNLGNISPSTSGQALVSTGAGAAPAFGNVSLTAGVTGTLAATNGGTGAASYTTGDLLYASSATALSKLTAATSGKLLQAAGTSTAPAWSAFTFPTAIATGDLVYGSATNALTALTAVATGRVLTSAGTGTAPAWSANAVLTGYFGGAEMAPPGAPAANSWRLYASDVGGKTVLYAIFGTGAAQAVATEP